jgi:hypothetical protein
MVVLAACGGDDTQQPIDARPIDAPPTMCPPQTATPLPPGNHKLYLVYEGVDLTKGDCDDSKTNCTSLITASQTVPPFAEQDSNRANVIAEITDIVRAQLAPYSIDVVTERPTANDYYMITMGGTPLDLFGMANVGAVAQGLCDASHKNGVSVVAYTGPGSRPYYATSVLSNFGAMIGMAVTTKKDDCMCRAGTECNSTNEFTCTYGVDVPVNATVHSCGRTTQHEPKILLETLGCR